MSQESNGIYKRQLIIDRDVHNNKKQSPTNYINLLGGEQKPHDTSVVKTLHWSG